MARFDASLAMRLSLAVAIVIALFAMFGPHRMSAAGLERTLAAKVKPAVAAAAPGVEAAMDGQTAVLTGYVASAAEAEAAREAALRAAGPGGVFLGGVTQVRSELQIAPRAQPFRWSASLAEGRVSLSGYVSSSEAKEELLALAQRLYRGRVSQDLSVALGAPPGDWTGVAAGALTQLAKLKRGSARLVDAQLFLLGEGEQAQVSAVQERYRGALSSPYVVGALELSIEGQGFRPPGLEGGAPLSSAPTAESCQLAFNRLTRGRTIDFATDSAELADEASLRLLKSAAAVARRCDGDYSIRIIAHIDDLGDDVKSMELSQRRADAVRGRLIGLGVAPDRLLAEGRGAAQPVAPNTSPTNRARNRRIEFEVT